MRLGALAVWLAMAAMAVGSAWADGVSGLWSKAQFDSTRAQITQSLAEPGGKYREIDKDAQKKVVQTLDQMEQIWQGIGDGQPSQAQQVELANDQEIVTTALTKASADSRVVCERTTEIGSNMPKNICKTVAQRKREMIQAQDAARNQQLESH